MDLHRNLRLFNIKWSYLDRQDCDKSIFRSDVNDLSFQCFRSVVTLLPGNNLHLQKIGFAEIDILMVFIEFLEIGGFFLKFLG